jgi:hypothetical protein
LPRGSIQGAKQGGLCPPNLSGLAYIHPPRTIAITNIAPGNITVSAAAIQIIQMTITAGRYPPEDRGHDILAVMVKN